MLYNNAHEHAHTYKCTQLTDLEVSSSQQVKLQLKKLRKCASAGGSCFTLFQHPWISKWIFFVLPNIGLFARLG